MELSGAERGDQRVGELRIELSWAASRPPGDLDLDPITASQDDGRSNNPVSFKDTHRAAHAPIASSSFERNSEPKSGKANPRRARRLIAQTGRSLTTT